MQPSSSKTNTQIILSELKGRPLVWLTFAFIGALMFWQVPVAVLLCLFVLVFISKPIHYVLWVIMICLGLMLGPRFPERMVVDPHYFIGSAEVIQAPRPISNGERCIVQVEGRKLIAYLPQEPVLAWGDHLEIRGIIKPLSEKTFDYWRGQGLSGQITIQRAIVTKKGPNLTHLGQSTRIGFVQFLSTKLDHKLASIVGALGLNHDPDLPQELRDALTKTGTIHIISTSGMHVMLISTLLATLLAKAPLPRWVQMSILLVLIIIYGAAAGFRPPMMRAIFMTIPLLLAYLFKRESDGLTTLSVSAIATLMMYPEGVFDIGVILSFISVLALILFTGMQNEAQAYGFTGNIKKFFVAPLKVSVVASVATAPILAAFFGGFSLISPFVNLLIAPTIPIIVIASMVAWGLDGVLPGLSNLIMSVVVEPLAKWLYLCVMNGSEIPFCYLDTGKIPYGLSILLIFLGLSLWRPKPKNIDEPIEIR